MAFIYTPEGLCYFTSGSFGSGLWKNDPDAGECSQLHQGFRLKCFSILLGSVGKEGFLPFAPSNKPASAARSEAEAGELLARLS